MNPFTLFPFSSGSSIIKFMNIRKTLWVLTCAFCLVHLCASLKIPELTWLTMYERDWRRTRSAAADAEVRDYKARNGATPEYLEALSWMARGEAAAKQWDQAASYASETRTLCEAQLAKRKVDAEPRVADCAWRGL